MTYYFIMNPGSCGGKGLEKINIIHEILKSKGISYEYDLTESLEHACDLSQKANMNGFDVIVAVGGDGTINRVLNGFYDMHGKRISRTRLGVIHTGTSPDFCKNYGIPTELNKAVETVLQNKYKTIDVGRIDFGRNINSDNENVSARKGYNVNVDAGVNSNNNECDSANRGDNKNENYNNAKDAINNKNYNTRYFLCCANIGLGAALATHANSGIRKKYGDTFGTFLSLLKTLKEFKPIDVYINGVEYKNVYNISVGKTYYVASGLKIKNNCKSNDNRFYFLPISGRVISTIWKMYFGRQMDLSYTDDIKIEGCVGSVEFDGDAVGFLPCRITHAEDIEVLVSD